MSNMHVSTDLIAFNNAEPNDNLNTLGSEVDAYSRVNDAIGQEVFSLAGENAVLRENTFGILSDDGSIEDKIVRLLNLLPMAFQVMDEARETISRLRTQIEDNDRHSSDSGC